MKSDTARVSNVANILFAVAEELSALGGTRRFPLTYKIWSITYFPSLIMRLYRNIL